VHHPEFPVEVRRHGGDSARLAEASNVVLEGRHPPIEVRGTPSKAGEVAGILDRIMQVVRRPAVCVPTRLPPLLLGPFPGA